MNSRNIHVILNLAQSRALFRARDVELAGASRSALAQLVKDGQLCKISRGLYSLPDRAISEHDTLVEVATKCPQGVVCLISALRYHELTTQQSGEIWLAIPHKAHPPKLDYPPLHIVHMSGDAMTQGIELMAVGGATIRVFSVAKTVADCFKYRNKVGLDVALEALPEALQLKPITINSKRHGK